MTNAPHTNAIAGKKLVTFFRFGLSDKGNICIFFADLLIIAFSCLCKHLEVSGMCGMVPKIKNS